MTRSYEDQAASPEAGLLQLARIKAGLSQSALAAGAGVPVTMVSAYERGKRQPTLATLRKLVAAAGFEIRLQLAEADDHDSVLGSRERRRSKGERLRRDRELAAWRAATPVITKARG